jgi:hypothetical protein
LANYLNLLDLIDNGSNSNSNGNNNNEIPIIDPWVGGGGGSSGNSRGNSTTAPKKIAYSISQFKSTGGYIKNSCNCMCMSQKIMKQILGNTAKIGSSANVMQLYLEDKNGALYKVGNAKDVFNTLNDHINANRPIITGVNHRDGHPGNSDKTTDHFIVITGRGYDAAKGQYYYNYVETGRTVDNGAGATSDSNRLYYDSSVGTFKTEDKAAQGGKTYTITQIRPNNN